jgi:hypothetical protein
MTAPIPRSRLMPRNFGLRRNLFGAEPFDRYWHDNDNSPEPRWPHYVIAAAAVALFAACILL